MPKLRVDAPTRVEVKDLTSPRVIEHIWTEAERESRREATELRARRKRATLTRTKPPPRTAGFLIRAVVHPLGDDDFDRNDKVDLGEEISEDLQPSPGLADVTPLLRGRD